MGGEGVFAGRVRWLISRGGRRPGGGCSGRRERGPGTRFVVGGFRGGEENCSEEHFALDTPSRVLRHAAMNAAKTRWCWRRDLAEFRGLTDRERTGFLLVLSKSETQRVFGSLSSPERYELPARLQYGAGLRRSELVRLRIKDVDLERGTLTVRQGKGDKDCPRLRRRPAACMAAPPQPWKVGKNVITFGAVGHAAAAQPARGGGPPDRGGAESLAARPSGGSGRGAHTGCAGAEVPPGRGELRVVLALSGETDMDHDF